MTAKYWRLTVQGTLSHDKITEMLPEGGGNILRIHTEKGETSVYFAAEKMPSAELARKAKTAGKLEEVDLKDVVTI
ncbi:MAG: hypothetical protein WC586_13545 [Methanoregula sp.]